MKFLTVIFLFLLSIASYSQTIEEAVSGFKNGLAESNDNEVIRNGLFIIDFFTQGNYEIDTNFVNVQYVTAVSFSNQFKFRESNEILLKSFEQLNRY